MKVETPLGAYPFQFGGVERRGRAIAITGTVAGLRSSVLLEPADLRRAARLALPTLAVLALAARLCRGRR